MPEAIVCPFCNCQIDALSPGRAACPRCDAALPAELASRLPVREASASVPKLVVPGKRKTLLAIVGIWMLMAAVTAGYALWTQNYRRSNDFKKGFVVSEPTSQPPQDLAAIGFLPAKCNVLGGVNVEDVRRNPLAKAALLDDPPRSIVWLDERLQDTAGLSIKDVDQVAVGVEMPEGFPTIYVVVQFRQAYDFDRIAKAFGTAKALTFRDRPARKFPLPTVGEGIVWSLSERRLAFLFRVEPGPVEGLAAFPESPPAKREGVIAALIQDRIDKQSLAWLAADMGPSEKLVDFLSFVNARPELYRPLIDAKAVTVSLKADRDLVVIAQVLAKNDKAARELAEHLREADWRGAASVKVELPPSEAKAEPWVTLQLRYEPTALRELLSRGPAAKK